MFRLWVQKSDASLVVGADDPVTDAGQGYRLELPARFRLLPCPVQHLAQDADEHPVDDENCPREEIVRLADPEVMNRRQKIGGAGGGDHRGHQAGPQTSQHRTEDDGQHTKEQLRLFVK